MEQKDLLELLKTIIKEELRYYGHYLGKVVNTTDPAKLGRVLVTVPKLSWDTEAVGPWCVPRQQSAIVTPVIGQFVEIYFMDGDRDQPRYHGNAMEMEDSLPTKHKGLATNQVIFEDGKTQESILYKQNDKILEIIGNTDFLLKGDAFIDAIVQWVPVPQDGGASLKSVIIATLLSKKVKIE